MKKKPPKVSRRDFIAASLGAAAGSAVFKVAGPKESASREPAGLFSSKPSLATSHRKIRAQYDVVIIGSGYGGAILASRLAHPKRSVALLERGKEWLPGDFPTTELGFEMALRTPVNPLGLFDMNVTSGSHLDVVTGCGLGGTSLINAAIASRPLDNVWEQPVWPAEIRQAALDGTLDKYYARAEQMLRPGVDPKAPEVANAQIHQGACDARGVPFDFLRLNVSHPPCTRCGDCCAGCNLGAKNTTQMNYLPLAKSRGCEIHCGIEVKYIEKLGSGWKIHHVWHPGAALPGISGTIEAKVVILAAGSQGSSEILLRSRSKGLRLSRTLGTRMSANGDVLGFSYNGFDRTDVVGYGNTIQGVRAGWPAGQGLTSYGDYRRRKPDQSLESQFLLIAGTIPTALTGLIAKGLAAWAKANPKGFTAEQLQRVDKDLYSLRPGADGALNHSLLLLACGHDSSGGQYVFNGDGHPRVVWPGARDEPSFVLIDREMAEHAKLHGGVYLQNPRNTVFGGERLQATHPLGGCPMGHDVDSGVVGHDGRVFDPDRAYHDGLWVADGSILPHSLAATPLWTISALAERIADIMLAGYIAPI